MLGTNHSKTKGFQKTFKYKTNEQITKYSNWNMQMQIQRGKISICSFCVCMFVPSSRHKLYWASSMQLVGH